MIFVVVGTQGPFDRLVGAVDRWAESRPHPPIVAQIGPSSRVYRQMQCFDRIGAAEFHRLFEQAELVVAHAGMGTIITALELGKPILVMPRLARYREQRNDHQVDTAIAFQKLGQVAAAFDEAELRDLLDRRRDIEPPTRIGANASAELLEAIRGFIENHELIHSAR